MKIERTKNAIRNISWGYIQRLLNIIFPFIFRTVMIYALGSEYLGINSLFTSILQVLNLSELGFGSAIVYNMYQPIAENNSKQICALLNYYKKIYFAIGCVILCLGLFIMPFIPYLIAGTYPKSINIYFVYFMFLLNTSLSYFFFSYAGSLLNAFQRNDLESKAFIIVSIFRYGIEIAGIYITHKYYLFLLIELISTILLNYIKYIYTKRLFPQYICNENIESQQKKIIKSNVIALMYHKVGATVLNSADNIVISAFMGVITVSNYNNYYYIMNAIEGIIIICFTGLTGGIGNSFIVETIEKNKNYFKKTLFFNAWIVGFCSVCLVCLYQDFMRIWVGEDYMFNDNIIVLIVTYFFVHNIRRTIITFRDGAGMWQDNQYQPIVSALFNIIFNIILVNIIGIAGILISSILSMLLIDIPWESNMFCKKIRMKTLEYFKLLFVYSLTSLLTAIFTKVLTNMITFSPIVNLILKGILCFTIPNIIFIIIFHKKDEFFYFYNLVHAHIKTYFKY